MYIFYRNKCRLYTLLYFNYLCIDLMYVLCVARIRGLKNSISLCNPVWTRTNTFPWFLKMIMTSWRTYLNTNRAGLNFQNFFAIIIVSSWQQKRSSFSCSHSQSCGHHMPKSNQGHCMYWHSFYSLCQQISCTKVSEAFGFSVFSSVWAAAAELSWTKFLGRIHHNRFRHLQTLHQSAELPHLLLVHRPPLAE